MKLDVPLKIVGSVDQVVLRKMLDKITPEDWLVYDYRKPEQNMADCSSIVLRHSSEYSTNTIRNMPLYGKFEDEVLELLAALRKFYPFREYVAFLALLRPGGVIGKHIDGGEFLETIHRLHIPIKTNPDCFYLVEDIRINMTVGTVYEIDNTRLHGVENNGSEGRIHLVFNLYPE